MYFGSNLARPSPTRPAITDWQTTAEVGGAPMASGGGGRSNPAGASGEVGWGGGLGQHCCTGTPFGGSRVEKAH
jgi:hypothetical protein